jgi:hypothetical protein
MLPNQAIASTPSAPRPSALQPIIGCTLNVNPLQTHYTNVSNAKLSRDRWQATIK